MEEESAIGDGKVKTGKLLTSACGLASDVRITKMSSTERVYTQTPTFSHKSSPDIWELCVKGWDMEGGLRKILPRARGLPSAKHSP